MLTDSMTFEPSLEELMAICQMEKWQQGVGAQHVHGAVMLVEALPQSMWLNLMMHVLASG